MLALLAGCNGLQRGPVPSERLSGCPQQSAALLAAEQNALGPTSTTQTLVCALNVLRSSRDPAISRTALGSRLCLYLAERDTNPQNREKFAAEGVKLAEVALKQGGVDDGAVHYYLAANLGLAVRDNIVLAVQNLGRLESEMKQALALNPKLDDGGPMRLLGALYLKAPAWPQGIGDLDKALQLLQQAVKQFPRHPLNHLFYAQALWEDGGKASLPQVKSEFALGEMLLIEGPWGYSKDPWKKEFDAFRGALADAGELASVAAE
ncbi:MAG: sterol transporter outer membrane protein BstC [Gammaproteobacteria bacterium]